MNDSSSIKFVGKFNSVSDKYTYKNGRRIVSSNNNLCYIDFNISGIFFTLKGGIRADIILESISIGDIVIVTYFNYRYTNGYLAIGVIEKYTEQSNREYKQKPVERNNGTNYFYGCINKQQAKVIYRSLSKKYHTDLGGGDLDKMQDLNSQYEKWK